MLFARSDPPVTIEMPAPDQPTTPPQAPAAAPSPVTRPEVVHAVVEHMNADHAADCLAMCRAATGDRTLDAASLRAIDEAGLDFDAVGVDGPREVRIPWRRPLQDRADIR